MAVVCANNLKLPEVRALIKKYPSELGHIRTAGKGRTKAVINNDLWKWIDDQQPQIQMNDEHSEMESDSVCGFNQSLSVRFPKQFMAKEHYPFAQQILSEYRTNRWFQSWEDVEQRVKGFKRTMITDREKCGFCFTDPDPGHTLC